MLQLLWAQCLSHPIKPRAYRQNNEPYTTGCDAMPILADKFSCYASLLNPLSDGAKTSFTQCIIKCDKKQGQQRKNCVSTCIEIEHSTPAAKACIEECGKITDSIKQIACLSNCRRIERINPNEDFTDGMERCTTLIDLIIDSVRDQNTSEDIKIAVSTVCGSYLELLPVCMTFSSYSVEKIIQDIKADPDNVASLQICNTMGFF